MDILGRVDAQHRAILDIIPDEMLDLRDIPAARKNLAEMFARLAGAESPAGVQSEDREVAASDGHPVLVRLYRGAETPDLAPALYWIHGGGMVLGDVSMNDLSCARLASELGIAVASVDYRLAPEHPYPTPLEDCYVGLDWFAKGASELGVDPARIAIGGGSAGGGLAAGLALLARDRGEIDIAFQLLVYPMLDDRNITPSSRAVTEPKVWNRESNQIGWNAYLSGKAGGDEVPAYAAPARATDLAGLPPAYIPVGELDLFVDENIAYAQALSRAGVPTELRVYPGAFHGSNGMVPHSELSKRWTADETEALRRGLGL